MVRKIYYVTNIGFEKREDAEEFAKQVFGKVDHVDRFVNVIYMTHTIRPQGYAALGGDES